MQPLPEVRQPGEGGRPAAEVLQFLDERAHEVRPQRADFRGAGAAGGAAAGGEGGRSEGRDGARLPPAVQAAQLGGPGRLAAAGELMS